MGTKTTFVRFFVTTSAMEEVADGSLESSWGSDSYVGFKKVGFCILAYRSRVRSPANFEGFDNLSYPFCNVSEE
jgi:hypothetical protein